MGYFNLLLAVLCLDMVVGYYVNPFIRGQECPVEKAGTDADIGTATMFTEVWPTGGACGFLKPNSDHAEGFFTAVGHPTDWEDGFACGTCAELEYEGTVITVNVVDMGRDDAKGWFDLGLPAWSALTKGAAPTHISGVKSRWVACPDNLTGGNNMQLYVKPGSNQDDALFQPVANTMPIRSLYIDGGNGWQEMKIQSGEYYFRKPQGLILNKGEYAIRIVSDTGNIDFTVPDIPAGTHIDTGTNNGGPCAPEGAWKPETPFEPETYDVDCSIPNAIYPVPENCQQFLKCAQGYPYVKECPNGLCWDPAISNCNHCANTDCTDRPVPE